ncbi:formate dehydrogenase subunit alpha [Candidatus Contubernalis alkaliaceticus]|uniref:formate dehydrogenase subunit alpha n=1 Tax=Candidatus Contubernalis alkaliaceticus TaxID=338645 RepID=UPI001F4C0763|nr:formate dehydrogenase subunit alpha [Candidatus Contubernalis alkalaceticus]UNC90830.1 formate dehydrogenase subunit alpha [Candidatus Contubernalis alkalaceticus]
MNVIKLTINGQPVETTVGTTILEAARQAKIDIPTFCHDPQLVGTGACRICVVEVENMKNLPASCVAPVYDGMVVHTESERVVQARKANLNLLLANHPLDCLTCEKNGTCKLQDYCYRYNVKNTDFIGEKKNLPRETSNPFYERDMNKCILCGKCARICHEINGAGAIDYANRGFNSTISTAFDEPLENSTCVFCGMCVDICPVGALTSKIGLGAARAWEVKKVKTTCPYCGTGCSFYLHVKEDKIVDVSPNYESPVNRGNLCVKGRFGWDFVHSPERLTKPLIKKDGKLVESTWEEALSFVADRIKDTIKSHGPDAIAGISSARCTNEDNYLLQKLFRMLGTNNIDHCARLCHAPTVAALATAFGSGAMTNSISEIEFSNCLLVTGSNTTETHPVISYRILKAKNRGTSLIVADPRRIGLAEVADIFLQHRPGSDVALFNGLLHVIIKENKLDQDFIKNRTEGFEEVKKTVEKYTPEYVEKITGVPAELIIDAALMYAEAETASILYTMGITQHTSGTNNVMSIGNLAMATGNLGKLNSGVNPLRGQNNVQGACDMGALPGVFPGYQGVTDPKNIEKFNRSWNAVLSSKPGLTVTEMFDAAETREIKLMYIMGENVMLSDANVNHVEKAIKNLDLLVVQDIFLTETAQIADVVFPAASFAEKDGTFSNTERRVQRIRRAVTTRGESRPDWLILSDLANKLGFSWDYPHPSYIMEEIASLTPSYGGLSYSRIENEGLQWPCPSPEHPGTPCMHIDKFVRGLGKFHAVENELPAEVPDESYPLVLTTGRMLYHYHTGTMTRRSRSLEEFKPEDFLKINPQDAEKLNITQGENVRVSSRRGEIETRVELTDMVPQGVVFMTFHYHESPVNKLTNSAIDPIAKIPELKVCAVKVEKIETDDPGPIISNTKCC